MAFFLSQIQKKVDERYELTNIKNMMTDYTLKFKYKNQLLQKTWILMMVDGALILFRFSCGNGLNSEQ